MRSMRLAAVNAIKDLFGFDRAVEVAQGWRNMRKHPAVIEDLVHLGHIFETDIDPQTGVLFAPDELRERAARRSLALQLLARSEITYDELNLIRETGETGNDNNATTFEFDSGPSNDDGGLGPE